MIRTTMYTSADSSMYLLPILPANALFPLVAIKSGGSKGPLVAPREQLLLLPAAFHFHSSHNIDSHAATFVLTPPHADHVSLTCPFSLYCYSTSQSRRVIRRFHERSHTTEEAPLPQNQPDGSRLQYPITYTTTRWLQYQLNPIWINRRVHCTTASRSMAQHKPHILEPGRPAG